MHAKCAKHALEITNNFGFLILLICMSNIPLIKSKHLLPYADTLRAHGIPVHRVLKSANLPLTCLDDPDTFIPAVCTGSFRELVAQNTACPNISLEAARYLDFETMGNFGHALMMEPTLLSALDKFHRLVPSETSNVIIELRRQSNGDLWFGQRLQSNAEIGEWHANLYVIIWMLKIVRRADPAWSPTEIFIHSKETRGHLEAIEALGSTSRFQHAFTGFMIPASMLSLPVKPNPVPVEVTNTSPRPTTPAQTYAGSVKQLVLSYATLDWLSIDQLCEVLDTSVRTLQRRLSAEQITYSSLIQQCRAEMAGNLLENTDMPIADIALQLGYTNQGNFTRAFYAWAKVSPSKFRKYRSRTN